MTRARFAPLLTILGAAALTTCTHEPTAPSRLLARVSVAPVLPSFASGLSLTIDQARITVVRPPQDTLVRDVITFPAAQDTIHPTVPVALTTEREDLDVTVDLLASGTVVFTGTRTVTVSAGSAVTPAPIVLSYQEPGPHVVSLVVGPQDSTLSLNDSALLRVTALDSAAQPVSLFYVIWSVSDSTAARVRKSGLVKAGTTRHTVFVRAQIPPTSKSPSGVVDSTAILLVPAPTQIARVSGDSQSATVSTPLPTLLSVVVKAADNLPVAGVKVTFAATSGGGSVAPLFAYTDTSGIASTTATLGAAPGANAYSASVNAGAVSVSFTATGTAAGPVFPTWTGVVSTDWSVPGNWSPAAVPVATDDVVVPSGPANLPVLTAPVGVKGLTVQPSASLNLGGQTLTVNGNLAANGPIGGSGTLFLSGSGTTVSGFLPAVDLNSPGNVTLAGNTALSGDLTLDAGQLVVAGHALTVAGALTLNSAGSALLTMSDPADSVDINGPVNWDAAVDNTGHLTAGVLVLRNTFFQGGVNDNAFVASGTHRTVFDGLAPQSIDPRGAGFRFQNLEIKGSGGVNVVTGFVVLGRTSVLTPNALGGGGSITANGRLSSVPGSTVAMGGLAINADSLAIGGAYGVTNTTITGGVLLPVLAYTNVDVSLPSGSIALAGNTSLSGNLTLDGGDMVVGGHALGVAGGLSLNSTTPAFLTMTSPLDSVDVAGPVNWDPSTDHTGHLTAGVLVMRNTFFQGGPNDNAFVATGTHRVVFDGVVPQSIDPRGNGFRFQTLDIRGSGGVSVLSSTLVAARTSVLSALNLGGGATLASRGRFSSVPGSTVAMGGLIIDADSLAIGGAYGVTNTTFVGGATLPTLAYVNLAVSLPAGTITLAGNTDLLGNLDLNSGELLVAGHALTVDGALTLTNGGPAFLTMTNPLDSVDIAGPVNWDPGTDHTGHLTAGVLVLRSTFFQGGPNDNAFVATGTHRVVFDGVVPQSIDPRGNGFRFQTLDIKGSGGVSVLTGFVVLGRTSVLTPNALGGGGSITANGRLSSVPGSTVAMGGLAINADSLAIGGAYGVTNTTITGGVLLPVLAYTNVDVNMIAGALTLTGNTNLSGSLTLDGGELVLGGHALGVAGAVTLNSTNTVFLTMTNSSDSMDVGGPVQWDPGTNHTGHLTAGVLVLRGTFFQGGPNDTAFAASGTHRVVFDGTAAQSMDPRGAQFHYQNLEVRSTAGVSLLQPITVAGQLIAANPVAFLNGGSLQTASVNVTGLVLNGVAFKIIEPVGVTEKFDNVTFAGYNTNVIQLTLSGPGGAAAPRSLTFNNLAFMPLAAGDPGMYVTLLSSNGFGLNLSLPGANESPQVGGNGPAKSSPPNQTTVAGATVLWP